MMFAPLLLLSKTPAPVPSASPSLPSETSALAVPGLFASLLKLHAKGTPKPTSPVMLPETDTDAEPVPTVKKETSDLFSSSMFSPENLCILQAPPVILSPSTPVAPPQPLPLTTETAATLDGTSSTPPPPIASPVTKGLETLEQTNPMSLTPPEMNISLADDLDEPTVTFSKQEIRSSLKSALGLLDPALAGRDFTDSVVQKLANTTVTPNRSGSAGLNRSATQSTTEVVTTNPHPPIPVAGSDDFNRFVTQSGLNDENGMVPTPKRPASTNDFDVEMVQVSLPKPTALTTPDRPAMNRPGYEKMPDESGLTDAVESARLNGRGEIAGGIHAPVGGNDFDMEMVQVSLPKPAALPLPDRPAMNRPGYETMPDESGFTDAAESARLNGRGEVAGDIYAPAGTNDFDAEMVQVPLPKPTPLPNPERPAINRPGYETTPDESGFTDAAESARLNGRGLVAGDIYAPAGTNDFDAEMVQVPLPKPTPLPTPERLAINQPGYETTPDESGFTDAGESARLSGRGLVAGDIDAPVVQNNLDVEIASASSPTDAPAPLKPALKKEPLPAQTSPETIPPSRVDTFLRPPTVKENAVPTFVSQISQAAEDLVKTKQTTLHLQLSPETLGPIDLQLTSGKDGTRVTLVTNLPETGTLLTQHLDDLRASLAQAGVAVNGLVVQYQTGEGQSGWARAWYQPPAAPTSHNFSEKEALSESDELSPQPRDVSGLDYRI